MNIIRQKLVNSRVNLGQSKRRFFTDAEVFEFGKMNGADSEVRIKLINFNRHFKDRHIFSSDLYFKIKKDIRKVAHSSPGLLRDLKIALLRLYENFTYYETHFASTSESDTDSESDTS